MNRWIRQSFRREIFAAFILISLVLVLISGIVSTTVFYHKIRVDENKRNTQAMEEIKGILDKEYNKVIDTVRDLSAGTQIQKMMDGEKYNDYLVYYELYQKTEEIRSYCNVELYKEDRCICSTAAGVTSGRMDQQIGILKLADENPGRLVCRPAEHGVYGEEKSIQLAEKLVAESPVYVLIHITQKDFSQVLDNSISNRYGICIATRFWEPVFYVGSEHTMDDVEHFRENLMLGKAFTDGYTNTVYETKLARTGLMLFYITPPVMAMGTVDTMYRVILLLSALSFVLCLMISRRLSHSFAKPIQDMMDTMEKVQNGDLNARMNLGRQDEFAIVSDGFNEMTEKIREDVQEKVQGERALHKAQIAMTQAQLNPHFLYNTLDTIKWAAKAGGVPEIGTLSTELAKILRQSISGKEFIPLWAELELIKSYCNIQNFRFDNAFQVNYHVPEEVLCAKVPKLILQPVVENAIIHGFPNGEGGIIDIVIFRHGDLVIEVFDDGVGIDEETIEALRDRSHRKLEGHIGFANVDTILRMTYGDACGLMAERREEGGTKVWMRIPWEISEDAIENKGKTNDTDNGSR